MFHVGLDYDGVLVDSGTLSLDTARGLLALAGSGALPTNRSEEREQFTPDALTTFLGDHAADALLAARPAVMAARSHGLRVRHDVIETSLTVADSISIITAGYGWGVRRAVGTSAITEIVGREDGEKGALLAERASSLSCFVTDTVTDVLRCREAGIATVIGVAWGFDRAEDLRQAGCTDVVDGPAELALALSRARRSRADRAAPALQTPDAEVHRMAVELGLVKPTPDGPVMDTRGFLGAPAKRAFLLDQLSTRLVGHPALTIGGVQNSGSVLGVALAERLDLPFVNLLVDGPRRSGLQRQLEPDDGGRGRSLVLVDNFAATGASLLAASHIATQADWVVRGALVAAADPTCTPPLPFPIWAAFDYTELVSHLNRRFS